MNRTDTIIWDWNGTLLNDTAICINVINNLLKERNLTPLTPNHYKEIFTFPVRNYYLKAGFNFNKENFETPANEFITAYSKKIKNAKLHHGVNDILTYFNHKNYRQFIVSAMETHALKESVRHFNLGSFFERIAGISDHYAHSKTENAQKLISDRNLDPNKVCLIGDTIHDHEVAETIGCNCILIADGHQSKKRLLTTGRLVLDKLDELRLHF